MRCQSCGFESPPAFRFCGSCGSPLVDSAARADVERKVVTVLFADLVGSTEQADGLDPEDVRARLGPYFALLRGELEKFGGTVEKFIGDAVMAVFGAPVAHEDDPERAVRAALAIRDAVAELAEAEPGLDLRVRVAVNTGEALVTLTASLGEGEGMVAGDVVNTAYRLQEVAPPGGVLVGEATFRATRDSIDYRELLPARLKGKSGPVAVWEAMAPRARLGAEVGRPRGASLVGRQAEVGALLGALARAMRERAVQLVTLIGVPGIGKTRLVAELFAAVDADPEWFVYWRQGRSLPYGDGVTFWALGEMTKAHAGILETDAAGAAAEKLSQAVADALTEPGEARWVESHLRPLVGLGGEPDPRADRRGEAFAAWRRFFEAIAERRPLVLVFEDLHWADDGLLEFVDELVDWASGVPLLVLATARPELLERRSSWGGGKRNAATLSLSPLTDEEMTSLVRELLGEAELPAESLEALVAHAEGNPLYAEQFVRLVGERGSARDLPLPESVQGIIAARLDALPTEEKLLIQDAAVIGKGFWVGALAAFGGLPRWSLEERLHTLERKEFVRRERRSSVAAESQYSFRHVLMRDVAYSQIPRARRAEKHRLAAEWIESLAADRWEDRAEMLAHHYLSALDFDRAAGEETAAVAEQARIALCEAGDRASSLSAFEAAARFYSRALELWPADDRDRTTLVYRYGRALLHGHDAGEEELLEARDGFLEAGDRAAAAEAASWLVYLTWMDGRRDEGLAHVARARELVVGVPASLTKANVLVNLSRTFMVAGEHRDSIALGTEALQMAEQLGLDDLRAHALTNVGVSRVILGDRGGIDDLERAVEIAEAAKSTAVIRAYLNLGSTLANLGELRRAFELQAAGRRAAEQFGMMPELRWSVAEETYEHYLLGRWDEAAGHADEIVAESETGARRYWEIPCRVVRGHIRLARGDENGAIEDADHALAFAQEIRDPQLLFQALAFAAFAAFVAGRPHDVETFTTELLESSSIAGDDATWLPNISATLAGIHRGEELGRLTSGLPLRTAWVDAAEACVAGDHVRAAELYEAIGSLPDEANSRVRAADALLGAGDRRAAEHELARALAFYRSVGATAYIRNAEALLASV
ncbi:MAG: hypothetical protein E6G67_10455 [Actinobacteria bacterium]|nr:MAG: hypothetical protein E6G67_10455 [Actinomycetota bacterium]